MEQYPQPKDNDPWKTEVTRQREADVADMDNIPKQYLAKSNRGTAPVNSADIAPIDKVGDFYFALGFLYILNNNSGTLKWQRVALSDF